MPSYRIKDKLAKVKKPKALTLFVPDSWKYNFFEVVKKKLGSTRNAGEIIKAVLEEENLKRYGKDISKMVVSLVKDPSKLPAVITSQEEEFIALNDAVDFLNTEFGCKIEVVKAEESKEAKARQAIPGKPAILVK